MFFFKTFYRAHNLHCMLIQVYYPVQSLLLNPLVIKNVGSVQYLDRKLSGLHVPLKKLYTFSFVDVSLSMWDLLCGL